MPWMPCVGLRALWMHQNRARDSVMRCGITVFMMLLNFDRSILSTAPSGDKTYVCIQIVGRLRNQEILLPEETGSLCVKWHDRLSRTGI